MKTEKSYKAIRVQQARKYAGLTQEGLASKASEKGGKLSESYVKAIEQGKREPSDRVLRSIAEICDVRYEWLSNPFDNWMTKRDHEQHLLFSEESDKLKSFLEDGYNYFVWYALQQLRDEYEIGMKSRNVFEISKEGQSITIDGSEIKKDLFEYAEFKLKKLIDSLIREKTKAEAVKMFEASGISVNILTEED